MFESDKTLQMNVQLDGKNSLSSREPGRLSSYPQLTKKCWQWLNESRRKKLHSTRIVFRVSCGNNNTMLRFPIVKRGKSKVPTADCQPSSSLLLLLLVVVSWQSSRPGCLSLLSHPEKQVNTSLLLYFYASTLKVKYNFLIYCYEVLKFNVNLNTFSLPSSVHIL